MKIIYSEKCLNYSKKNHPESPKRVKTSYNLLKEKNFDFLIPEIAKKQEILKVHSEVLFEKIKSGNFYSLDSPPYENIFYYASLSSGAAIKAMELSLNQKYCFSLMRPPGHHAGRTNLGGFCYFNSISIAVAKALKEKNVNRVAIIDIDIHHGNGTKDIFLGNSKVIYISLHQFPHYPGTGEKNERNCYNYPLPSGINEERYLEILKKAINNLKEFYPDLIAVSAGFDTYKKDPLGGFKLEIESYEKIGKIIKNLNKPTFSVLEGGYSEDLGKCIYSYLKGFE